MMEREPMRDPSESDVELQVEAIAERFLDRLQAGEAPDKKALVSAHPEIADRLGRHLALVEMLHRARFRPDVCPGSVGRRDGGHP